MPTPAGSTAGCARGLNPAAPRLYPRNNRLKSYAQRALARIETRFPLR